MQAPAEDSFFVAAKIPGSIGNCIETSSVQFKEASGRAPTKTQTKNGALAGRICHALPSRHLQLQPLAIAG